MTTKQIELIRASWTLVSAIDPETVGNLFYTRLFEIAPEVKPMFRNSLSEQSKKLLTTLGYVISSLNRLDSVADDIAKLAHRHVKYGVKPVHYIAVGEALLWTLEKGLGEHWNNELKEAWSQCYSILSAAMIGVSDQAKNAA
ncbi:MAG: globin family protein [Sphingobacteriales bacterium]